MRRWTLRGAVDLTALAANAHWVVIGGRDGTVVVLRPDGALVARMSAHDRLVSDVVLRGDRLYSGSWDGHVRRWDLSAATVNPEARVAELQQATGLSLARVLGEAEPPH